MTSVLIFKSVLIFNLNLKKSSLPVRHPTKRNKFFLLPEKDPLIPHDIELPNTLPGPTPQNKNEVEQNSRTK